MPKNRYDIVFWAHGHNEIERFLPLMVSLRERGLDTLLFYQNYDFRDGLPYFQQKIVKEYGLDVLDYSYFIKNSLLLKLISAFVSIFRRARGARPIYDKLRGLRTKFLRPRVTEGLIRDIILKLKPKVSFFDNLYLIKYTSYPYGSYYIKKVSDESGIKCLSITHGGSVYLGDVYGYENTYLDYHKIYVPNDYEKTSFERQCADASVKVSAMGDPRFDDGWKIRVKNLFSEEIKRKIGMMGLKKNLKILYLAPNIEALGKTVSEEQKYRHLGDIASLCEALGDTEMLIKLHPRYRNIREVKKVMRRSGFKDFHILEDDPLICYLDFVDYIISPGTSALGDVLPEGRDKIIILDVFFPLSGVENIFGKQFAYFDSLEALRGFLTVHRGGKRMKRDNGEDVTEFCRKWIAAGEDQGSIVRRLSDDIYEEVTRK